MVKEGLSELGIILIIYHFIKNVVVACFLDVCSCGKDHPQGVIVEVCTCGIIALLGKGLILVVVSAILKLSSGDIKYSLSCSLGDLVNEAEDILVGITEAHSSSDTALKVGSRT